MNGSMLLLFSGYHDRNVLDLLFYIKEWVNNKFEVWEGMKKSNFEMSSFKPDIYSHDKNA